MEEKKKEFKSSWNDRIKKKINSEKNIPLENTTKSNILFQDDNSVNQKPEIIRTFQPQISEIDEKIWNRSNFNVEHKDNLEEKKNPYISNISSSLNINKSLNNSSNYKVELTNQIIKQFSQYNIEDLKVFALNLFEQKVNFSNFEYYAVEIIDLFKLLIKKPKEEHSEVIALLFRSELITNSMANLLKKSQEVVSQEVFDKIIQFIRLIYQYSVYLMNFDNDNLKYLPINETIEALELLMSQKYDESLESQYRDFQSLRQQFAKKAKLLSQENKSRATFLQFDFLVCEAQDVVITYKSDSASPSYEDLFKDENVNGPKFFPHVINGAYKSWSQYFNNLFYLLKEDFLEGLRKSIESYLKTGITKLDSEFFESVHLYTDPFINKINYEERELTYHLVMTPYKERKKQYLNWVNTKRLIYGTLLLICDIKMNKMCFASVANKPECQTMQKLYDEHKKILISIKAIDDKSEELELMFRDHDSSDLIVLECKAYFESYYHFLNKLKLMNTKTLPFFDYIVAKNDKKMMPPHYLRNFKFKVEIQKGQKFELDLAQDNVNPIIYNYLDHSQFLALKNILTNEISIIQGPPGTGKTFVGAQAVKILLLNKEKWNDSFENKPLLIVAYTNHALDQFLGHILKFTNKIVRIGGRCNDIELIPYMLRNLRKGRPLVSVDEMSIGAVMKNCRMVRDKLQKCLNHLKKNVSYYNFINFLRDDSKFDFKKKFDYELKEIFNQYGYIIHQECNEKIKDSIFQIWLNNTNVTRADIHKIVEKGIHKFTVSKDYKENFNSKNNYKNKNEDQNFNDDQSDYSEEDPFFEENKKIELNETELENFSITADPLEFPSISEEDVDYIWKNDYFYYVNIWELHPKDRKLLFYYVLFEVNKEDLEPYKQYVKDYKYYLKIVQKSFLYCDLNICKDAEVIGMTINGCAKYSEHLENLGSPITVIEEAGEVLEAHAICALTKNLQHLIMIGDHQQLRPSIDSYLLETKFNFSISLFERLIIKGINYVTLENQRRMRPDFADFIRIIYGSSYKDHDSILNYPNLRGISTNLYFFNHDWMENEVSSTKSKSNENEALFVSALANYFLKQNYLPSQITILSMYVGQTMKIKHILKKKYNILDIRVATVDNYQGEENEIVLLSLVRSNKKNILGFTSIENRICVALSRAKKGLYVFGNFDCLCKGRKTDLWMKIVNIAKNKNAYGNQLNLSCQNHQKFICVSQEKDFEKVPEGGCNDICNMMKECGHICKLYCHNNIEEKHKKIYCENQCLHKFEICGHECPLKCKEPCVVCKALVMKTLKCGHTSQQPCHIKESGIECKSACERILLVCKHKCPLLCYQQCRADSCKEIIEKKLPCGHIADIECNISVFKAKCQTKCKSELSCGHLCKGTCDTCFQFSLHIPCQDNCLFKLSCGHFCPKKCGEVCSGGCKEKMSLTCKCGSLKYFGICGDEKIECSSCPPNKIINEKKIENGKFEKSGENEFKTKEGRLNLRRKLNFLLDDPIFKGYQELNEIMKMNDNVKIKLDYQRMFIFVDLFERFVELKKAVKRHIINYNNGIPADLLYIHQIDNLYGFYLCKTDNDFSLDKLEEIKKRIYGLLYYKDLFYSGIQAKTAKEIEEKEKLMKKIMNNENIEKHQRKY